ncbi:MAG TPA: RNA 2',3'-cyclic phosphodiesterase [Kiritimatiellia bacterium]|nr:RNA 2',3'-cyclic phosphodiesterase [Kiritimatiellia bacterium]HOR98972.1 RNA 2',3'-cyclic phosphodiesterase [Kiritimatiellia bacterium]
MRLFLALSLPDSVASRLTDAVRRLEPEATDVAWCRRDQFHVTLAFLGDTAPAILPHLTAACERVCSACPSFSCRAYGFGFFGSKRSPRTLWAGVDPIPELMALQEAIWQTLPKFGFADNETHFCPHITLGRCRKGARNLRLIEAMDAEDQTDFGSWRVTRVTLYESRPSPRGPIYRAASLFPLATN